MKSKRNAISLILPIVLKLSSDRIRPACLPLSPSIIYERITDVFRIVRFGPFNVNIASTMKPIQYKLLEIELCLKTFHVVVSDDVAMCASANQMLGTLLAHQQGHEGDPFVVKVVGPQRTTPVYQVGLDVIHSKEKTGMFLKLYPYLRWIVDTTSNKTMNFEAEFN